jgi:hypothetical protein
VNTEKTHGLTLKCAQGCVGPGWSLLVEEAWTAVHTAGGYLADLKEKYGSMMISYSIPSAGSREVARQVREMERRSAWTCEACGQRGCIQDIGGWYKALCRTHHRRAVAGETFSQLSSDAFR